MGANNSKQTSVISNIFKTSSSKSNKPDNISDSYLIQLTNSFIHDIQQSLSNKYKNTSFDFFCFIPETITHVIAAYIPLFYQIYGITKHSKIFRVHSLEATISNTSNIYTNSSMLLIKSINNEIIKLSANKQPFQVKSFEIYQDLLKQLDDTDKYQSINIMNNGICAGNTVFTLQNGNIYYTSNINNASNLESNTNFERLTSLNKINIVDIGCGLNHILFLSIDGKVYSMGRNDKAQCGLGYDYVDILNITEPQLINEFVDNDCFISTISCGENHSCCIDNIRHDIWRFGDNQYFQCSFDAFQHIHRAQRYIYQNKQIIKAECGKTFTMALCDDGECYGFGAPSFAIDSKKGKIMKKKYNRCVWLLSNRVLFEDMSVGMDEILLIQQNKGCIYRFKYGQSQRWDYKMFDDLQTDSKPCKLIAGCNQSYFVFETR